MSENKDYDQDMIKKLIREALKHEKHKRYEAALEIYYNLASYKVKFATDRIKIIQQKKSKQKISNINHFMYIISSIVVTCAIILTGYYTSNRIIYKPSLVTNNTNEIRTDAISNLDKSINVSYKYTDDLSPSKDDFDIYISKSTSHKKLKSRIIEGVNLYKSEGFLKGRSFTINIKQLESNEIIGTIVVKDNDSCIVLLKR